MKKFFKISSIVFWLLGMLTMVGYMSNELSDHAGLAYRFVNGIIVKMGKADVISADFILKNLVLCVALVSLILGFVFTLITYRSYSKAYEHAKTEAAVNKYVAKTVTMRELNKRQKQKEKEQKHRDRVAAKKQAKLAKQKEKEAKIAALEKLIALEKAKMAEEKAKAADVEHRREHVEEHVEDEKHMPDVTDIKKRQAPVQQKSTATDMLSKLNNRSR